MIFCGDSFLDLLKLEAELSGMKLFHYGITLRGRKSAASSW
jgi:hypothetical protein